MNAKWYVLVLFMLCVSCAAKAPVQETPLPTVQEPVGLHPVDVAYFEAGLNAYGHGKFREARNKFTHLIAYGWDDSLKRKSMMGLLCVDLMTANSAAAQNSTLVEMEKWMNTFGRDNYEDVWMLLPYMRKNLSSQQRKGQELDLRLKVMQERVNAAEQNLLQSQTENQNLRMKLEQLENLYMEIQDKKKSIQ